MTPCPSCNADAGKPRVGTLGEHKGYWCTACGHTAPSLDAWRGSDQTQRSVATSTRNWITVNIAPSPSGLTAALDRFLKAHGYARTVNDDAAQIQIIGVWLGGDPNKQYTARHLAKHYGYRVAQDDTDEQLLDRMSVSP
jgi:hypothetical protein